MLVLTVQEDEPVYIGKDIIVMVTRIEGGRCKIGIEAPRSVVIEREGVRSQRLQEEGNDASI